MNESAITALLYLVNDYSKALASLRANRKKHKEAGTLDEETDNKIGYFAIKNRHFLKHANRDIIMLSNIEVSNAQLYDFLGNEGIKGILIPTT